MGKNPPLYLGCWEQPCNISRKIGHTPRSYYFNRTHAGFRCDLMCIQFSDGDTGMVPEVAWYMDDNHL